MKKFLQDWGKQILAAVSIALMIAWVLPNDFKQGGFGRNATVGTIELNGKEKISALEQRVAHDSWEKLRKQPIRTGNGQMVSLGMALLGPAAYSQIEAHPDLFLLLAKEARAMNIRVSGDQVEEIMHNYMPQTDNDALMAQYRQAVVDGLLVRNAFVRASSVIKITEPQRQHQLATGAQALTVNAVDFDAGKYTAKVAAPTTQAMQQQFDAFRTTLKGTVNPTTNPFGFGYKYPDRLKLQYIQIPLQAVRESVEKSRDAQRWEVDVRKYYLQHLDEFAATQPAAPTSAPSAFSLESTPKLATTQPFEQVHDRIKSQLVSIETQKKQQAILDRVIATLGGDYMPFRSSMDKASATSAPATLPASSMKVPYTSFEYLQKLAADIQKQFGVLPVVASLQDRFLSTKEVGTIQGLGQSYAGREPIGTYLQNVVMPFLGPDAKSESGVLRRYQPSMTLRDDAMNEYIVRVTEAQAAHPPDALAEVADQVRADLIKQEAYKLAKQVADALAKEATVGGLKSAAARSGATVASVGPLVNQQGAAVRGLTLPSESTEHFIDESFKLLSTLPAHPGAMPVRVADLPEAGKAIVTELALVTPMFSPDTQHLAAAQVSMMAAEEQREAFMRDWYNFDNVVARLKYKQSESDRQARADEKPPAPAQPPLF